MIEIINTGGTFNKIYNPFNGTLEVPSNFSIIEEIIQKSLFVNQKIKINREFEEYY